MIHVDFKEFKKTWANTNGYIPVYVYGDDDFSEKGFVQILMDMVCPHRLLDGKIMVLAVKLAPKDLPKFKEYMAMIGEYWNSEFLQRAENVLKDTNKFQ